MRDIADGKTLEVRATPQFFVNGKPLVNFGYEQLTQLVEEAIAEAY
jgi:protein-disulfide isomerase